MEARDLIRYLKQTVKEEENKKYGFGQIRIRDLAEDCLRTVEHLHAENAQLKTQLAKAVEDMSEIATSGYGTTIRARYCKNKSKSCTNAYNLCDNNTNNCAGFLYKGLEDKDEKTEKI